MIYIDIDGHAPKRGDLVYTNLGNRRERTWLILRVHRRRTQPKGVPRYDVWMARWWELEVEQRMALWRSAERHGGQRSILVRCYPVKKRKTFEQHLKNLEARIP